jgi:hypothetical protein
LVLFPPGITQTERRQLRLWRGWPIWGAALWLLSEIFFSQRMTPWEAIAASTIMSLAAGAVSAALVGHLRSQVRTLSALEAQEDLDKPSAAGYAELEILVGVLATADAMHRLGRLTTVDHEAVWWYAYHQLAPDHTDQIA